MMVTRIGIGAVPVVEVEAAEIVGVWGRVIVVPIAGAGVAAVPVAAAGVAMVPGAGVAALPITRAGVAAAAALPGVGAGAAASTALPMRSVVLLECILDHVRLRVSLW